MQLCRLHKISTCDSSKMVYNPSACTALRLKITALEDAVNYLSSQHCFLKIQVCGILLVVPWLFMCRSGLVYVVNFTMSVAMLSLSLSSLYWYNVSSIKFCLTSWWISVSHILGMNQLCSVDKMKQKGWKLDCLWESVTTCLIKENCQLGTSDQTLICWKLLFYI